MKSVQKSLVTTDNIILAQTERMLDCFEKSQEYRSLRSMEYNSFRLYRCHCIAEKIKSVIEEGSRYSNKEVSAIYGPGHTEFKTQVSKRNLIAYEKALERMSRRGSDFKKHSVDMDLVLLDYEEEIPF